MAKFKKRLTARQLRKKGKSLKEIAEQLNVSKGSVSLWCQDLQLTNNQKEFLRKKMIEAGHRGRLIGAEANRKKKEERIDFHKKLGTLEVGKLSARDLLMVGLGLYWGEGTKKSTTALVNSDPALVLFMMNWFKKTMKVKDEEFMPQIFINETHRLRANKVLTFWVHLLGLPKGQFRKTVFLKRKNKKIYDNHDSYYGVLALRIKNGSEIKYRIMGLIDALKHRY